MTELIEGHMRQELAIVNDSERDSIRNIEGKESYSVEGPIIEQKAELDRERVMGEWAVEMSIVERDLSLTHTGPPDQVINMIDPSAVQRLGIFAPKTAGLPIQATVFFSRTDGCQFEIRGSDPSWLRMARDTLSSEIKHGVPKWAWLRTVWGAIPGAVVIVLGCIMALWNQILPAQKNSLSERMIFWSLLGLMSLLLITPSLNFLLRRFLIGFEIVPPGVTPRSGRAIGVVASIVTSFVLGIVVNLITK
jgi:hypothetical protein